MTNNNKFNKIQINATVEKNASGNVFRKSLMINIRSNKVEEAANLYRQLKEKLNGDNNNVPTCKCGNLMVLRQGTKGQFYGCSTFPQCRNTKKLHEGEEPEVELEAEPHS